MLKRIIINIIKYGWLQIFSIICSFFGVMFGFVAISFGSLGIQAVFGDEAGRWISNFALPAIIIIMFLVYAIFWYVAISALSHSEKFNYKEVMGYAILPNIVLLSWFYYVTFILPPQPPGCGFITSRQVFFCLAYSIILFPIYIFGLNKYIFKAESTKKKVVNGLGLILVLVLTMLSLTSITMLLIPPHNFSIFLE